MALERLPEASRHAAELNGMLREGLAPLPGVTVNSPATGSPFILNISVDGIKPESLVHAFSEQDIHISTVSACSSKASAPSAAVLALTGDEERARHAIRISLSHLTLADDITLFLDHLRSTLNTFR